MKKLIRGVIYDNPNAVEERTRETAECLTLLADHGTEYYESEFADYDIPNRDEYITSLILAGLVSPITGDENMIIPSSLVDDRLYKDLKKIDIGENLVHEFIEATHKKHFNEEKFTENVGSYAGKFYEEVYPQDFCKGEEECLLRHVDKQNENRGKYFLDGKEVTQEEMLEFMENNPEFADVVPFIKAFNGNGKVSCF